MSAEDILNKFSEENGDLFYTENNNDIFDGSAGTVLRAMKEFAKQEAELAWDAAVKYEWNEHEHYERGVSIKYPDKEAYINNLFNNDK